MRDHAFPWIGMLSVLLLVFVTGYLIGQARRPQLTPPASGRNVSIAIETVTSNDALEAVAFPERGRTDRLYEYRSVIVLNKDRHPHELMGISIQVYVDSQIVAVRAIELHDDRNRPLRMDGHTYLEAGFDEPVLLSKEPNYVLVRIW